MWELVPDRRLAVFMGFDAAAGPPPTNSYVNSAPHQEAEECRVVPDQGELPVSFVFV